MAIDAGAKNMAEKAGQEEALHHEAKTEHVAITSEERVVQGFDAIETAKVLRKVDWRLLPVLSFLYLIAFIDRSNLGNASVAGLTEDLRLTGSQYNIAATVYPT